MARRSDLDTLTVKPIIGPAALTLRRQLTVDLGDGRVVTADLPARCAEAIARAADNGEQVALLILGEQLTTSEAAAALGLSPSALRKLIDHGVLASRRDGRDRLVSRQAVTAFKERREQMACARAAFARAAERHPQLFCGDDDPPATTR